MHTSTIAPSDLKTLRTAFWAYRASLDGEYYDALEARLASSGELSEMDCYLLASAVSEQVGEDQECERLTCLLGQ